jgi:hypothetical protein
MTSARKPLKGGAALTLYAVVNEDGVCGAEEWLAGLSTGAQGQFMACFEQLTAVGFLRGEERMHPTKGSGAPVVQEIKVHDGPGYRLYVIKQGRDWVATHGCKKPRNNKQVAREAKKARDIFAGYTERSHG